MVVDLVLDHQGADPVFVPQLVDIAERNGFPDMLGQRARRSEKLGGECPRCALIPGVGSRYQATARRRGEVAKWRKKSDLASRKRSDSTPPSW
jgi:hypothetical protein